jgi:hypothetical protein
MWPPAHIGNIPVEEWLPFLAPIVALVLYGRHRSRQRDRAVRRLPPAEQALDERTIELVQERWGKAGHGELSVEQVPLLYPPGPEGATPAELAARTRTDVETVRRQLEELHELGYLDLEPRHESEEPRAWLTIDGYSLLSTTEEALLAAHEGRGLYRASAPE